MRELTVEELRGEAPCAGARETRSSVLHRDQARFSQRSTGRNASWTGCILGQRVKPDTRQGSGLLAPL